MYRSTASNRRTFALLALLATLTLSGCGVSCEPTPINMNVPLALTAETVRTLPIIASGKTSLAGVDVPDSHGVLEWDTSFTDGRIGYVDVSNIQVDISIQGTSVPVEIVRVEGLEYGRLYEGGHLRLWWRVDPHRTTLTQRVLNEGDAYQARVSFYWSLDGCEFSGHGTAALQNQGFVQPSAITTTFNPGSAAVSTAGANASYEAHATIKNGISTNIQKVTAIAVALGDLPGAIVWTQSTITVNGMPVSAAAPGDDVKFSGSPLPATGSAPWLLVLYVGHQSTANPGSQQDTLAWLLSP